MNVVTRQAQDELARFRFSREPKDEQKQKAPRGTLVFADDKTPPCHVVSGFIVSRHIRQVRFD